MYLLIIPCRPRLSDDVFRGKKPVLATQSSLVALHRTKEGYDSSDFNPPPPARALPFYPSCLSDFSIPPAASLELDGSVELVAQRLPYSL